jgi:AAA+ ATPase superfamily predicted ATPase
MRNPSNPFIVTGYHSPAYFCDREEELSWLREQFINERNTVMYSRRRLGKTALIRHFFQYLKKEMKIDGIFVDLLGTTNLTDANVRIATAIIRQFGELKKGIGPRLMELLGSIGVTMGIDPYNGTPQLTFGLVKGKSVQASLEAIGNYLSEQKKPVVICIDEFQQIVHYPELNAEAIFRSWMQDFPMVRFIYCGSHRHMMVSMFSEESRPFYRSAEMKQLESLPVKSYTAFIKSHFKKTGKSIDFLRIDRIFQWTRMQTYYVQLVCNKLYGKTDQVIDETVEEVFCEIIQQEIPVFSSYQQLFSTFQWKLLVALAKAEDVENPYAQRFLMQYELGAASSVRTALRTLIRKEFVIYHEQKYTLHDTLLMRWLQQL